MPRLIINADDLGIHPRIDAGIRKGYESGLVTSASLLVTTPFVEDAVRDVINPTGLPIGLHVDLTMGRPASEQVAGSLLTNEQGEFLMGPGKLLLKRPNGKGGKELFRQIRREIESQFTKARDLGVRLTHVDSHQHIHANPFVFEILQEIAPRFGVSRIRVPREKFRPFMLKSFHPVYLRRMNFIKWSVLRLMSFSIKPRLRTTDDCFGIMFSGRVDKWVFTSLGLSLSGNESYEVALHPGYPVESGADVYGGTGYDSFVQSPSRLKEWEAVTAPDLRKLIEERNVRLCSFADI